VVDGLKALDPKRPIREADSSQTSLHVRFVPKGDKQLFDHLVGENVKLRWYNKP